MPEPAFDTLEAARRLKSAGIEVEHAETIVKVMGQSVSQLVTREHFDAGVAKLGTELYARIDGVESKVQSLPPQCNPLNLPCERKCMRK